MTSTRDRLVTFGEFERRSADLAEGRTSPHNLEAETAVLGAVLLCNEVLDEVTRVLAAHHFFRTAHALIFGKMVALKQRGVPVDPITLAEELSRTGDLERVGGPAYILRLTDGLPRRTNVLHYAGIIREKALRRAVIQQADQLSARAHDPNEHVASLAAVSRALSETFFDATVTVAAVSESLPTMIARLGGDKAPAVLVDDLIPGDGFVLLHGQPREFKSLVSQSLTLSVTTGAPAFNLQRLRVPQALPAWYITEEDSARRVAARFEQLARGLGVEPLPAHLHVTAGLGVSLDDADWQERLIATTRQYGFRLVVLDPLRSLTETADQGPRELTPLVLYLRRFIRETGAVVLIVHHDTKPGAFGRDNRRRPQRASGGGIFALADAPIHVERQNDGDRVLVPSDYKFQAEPPRIRLTLEQGPDWLRLVGQDEAAPAARLGDLTGRIQQFLRKHPNSSSSEVVKGVKASKQVVLRHLKRLAEVQQVTSAPDGKTIRWRVLCQDEETGSMSSPQVSEPTDR